jgi:uncharacterized protein involved in exopolysaccharide biosynthesis
MNAGTATYSEYRQPAQAAEPRSAPVPRRRRLLPCVLALASIWALTGVYLAFAPVRYSSQMTFLLPGSGVGGSLNLDRIGQVTSVTASAFSSPNLSPTENYKHLLVADVTLDNAARLAGESGHGFPLPTVKLVDQTSLIAVAVTGATAQQAQQRAQALRRAFMAGLDRLRQDEAVKREASDRARISELQGKVRDAQSKLLNFQSATGLVSIEQFNARIAALDALRDREQQQRTATAQVSATTARLESALGISATGTRQVFLLKADPLFQSLLTRYAALTTSSAEKGATLGSHHVTMEELNAQNSALRDALVARGHALTGLPARKLLAFADMSVADGRAQLFGTLVAADSQLAGASAALADMKQQMAEQTEMRNLLTDEAARLADMVRDLRVAEAVFSSALARLDTNKSDPFASYPLVQTLEEPSLPRKRSSPSLILALAGATAASLLILIGFGLLWLRAPIIRKLRPNA